MTDPETTVTAFEGIGTALSTIATDITEMLGDVAPIALGVFAIFIAWRLGKRFFNSLAK